MSIAIEMKPLLNLEYLPSDIIRKIVRLESDSATEMRLISHEWNTLAKVYLTKNTKLPASLERVYISRGVPEDVYEGRKNRETPANDREKHHMYAIVPERFSKRIGVGGWLDVHQKYSNGKSIEVTRIPQDLPPMELLIFSYIFAVMLFLSLCTEVIMLVVRLVFNEPVPVIFLIAGSVAIVLCGLWWFVFSAEDETNHRRHDRCRRLFAMFTLIDLLVLDNFRVSSNTWRSRHAMSSLAKMMKGVEINRLEIRENYLNKHLHKCIIELCRDHKVKQVLISATDFDGHGFRDFVKKLSKLDVILDLYEVNGMNDNRYFYRSIDWWISEQLYMSSQQILLRMATIHDNSFERPKFCYRVKSHIRCEKADGNNNARPLKSVPWRRGFNHRST